MRGVLRIVLGVVLVAGVVAVPGVAGAGKSDPVTSNVTKIVEGPVPDGTTFDVQIDCNTAQVDLADAEGGPTTQTITFDAAGGTQAIEVPQFQPECTITETDDGGAVLVACSSAEPSDPSSASSARPRCRSRSRTAGPRKCSVSITNTFEAVSPPPPAEPRPPSIPPTWCRPSPPSRGSSRGYPRDPRWPLPAARRVLLRRGPTPPPFAPCSLVSRCAWRKPSRVPTRRPARPSTGHHPVLLGLWPGLSVAPSISSREGCRFG